MARLNHLAILVALGFHQIVGGLWYSVTPWAVPRLLALGKPASEASRVDPLALGLDIVTWILACYVLAWLFVRLGVSSALQGAAIGALIWLGFEVSTLLPHYAFAGLAPVVTLADLSAALVTTVAAGAILGGWRKRTI
jgi:hypothetical protein